MKLKYRMLVALALLPLPALLVAAGGAGGKIEVKDFYVRAVPPVSPNTALFLTLQNSTGADRVLSKVYTPASKAAEIHLTRKTDKGMKMEHAHEVTIKAGENLIFSPEGYHIMLIGLKKPLVKGASVPVTLTFKNGEVLSIDAPVRKLMEKMEKMEKMEHPH